MNKVLIIEDKVDVRENIIALLEAEDFEAYAAENGCEGIHLAQQQHPDLILCDVMMPQMDGYEVLNLLRQDPETAIIPFVFLTAKAGKDDVRQGMVLGADDYLSKPFTRAELLEALHTRLAKKETQQQHLEQQLVGLQQAIAPGIPEKILAPLAEVVQTAQRLVQDAPTIQPEAIRLLGCHVQKQADFLQQAVQNYFLFTQLEFLARDTESLPKIKAAVTLCPGDLVLVEAMQKAKQCQRSKDILVELKNIPVAIEKSDLKKVVAGILDYVLHASESGAPITIQALETAADYTCEIQSQVPPFSAQVMAQLQGGVSPARQLLEEIDPSLELLVAQRMLDLYGGKMTFAAIPGQGLTMTISVPHA